MEILVRILLLLLVLSVDQVHAERVDTVMVNDSADSLKTKEVSKIRETIRGFDRTQDDYIEPNHFEFSVMFQATRTLSSFLHRLYSPNPREQAPWFRLFRVRSPLLTESLLFSLPPAT